MEKEIKCYEFEVDGMHCAACELLLEDKLKNAKGVRSVSANLSNKTVKVEVDHDENEEEFAKDLTAFVKDDGYVIVTRKESPENSLSSGGISNHITDYIYAIPLSIIFLLVFAILQVSGALSTGSASDLTQVFILGIIASLSSCMALIGGLVLALSNRYSENNIKSKTAHLSFHIGRLGGFFILGGILGIVGSILRPSATFTLILTIAVSIIMIILGLSQLGLNSVSKFQLKTPKTISRKILAIQEINNSFIPLILGVLTFFLPCGFTLAVQGVALEEGDFIKSALTMFVFALGTFPVLGLLSFASVNFAGKLKSGIFLKTTGLIIIAFALYNIHGSLVSNGII